MTLLKDVFDFAYVNWRVIFLNGNVFKIVDVSPMIFIFDGTSLPRLVWPIDLIPQAFLR